LPGEASPYYAAILIANNVELENVGFPNLTIIQGTPEMMLLQSIHGFPTLGNVSGNILLSGNLGPYVIFLYMQARS
jgi:hypothetical protein